MKRQLLLLFAMTACGLAAFQQPRNLTVHQIRLFDADGVQRAVLSGGDDFLPPAIFLGSADLDPFMIATSSSLNLNMHVDMTARWLTSRVRDGQRLELYVREDGASYELSAGGSKLRVSHGFDTSAIEMQESDPFRKLHINARRIRFTMLNTQWECPE